jgi:hypothetical protein
MGQPKEDGSTIEGARMKITSIQYWYIHKWNLYLGVPPKCGCTSVALTLRTTGITNTPVRAPAIPDGAQVVFVVRHPLDRFKSSWRFFCVPGGDKYHGTGRKLHGLTPDEMWLHMLKTPDRHWTPQSDLLEDLRGRCNVTIIRLDDLTTWWEARSKIPLETVNQTRGRVPSSYDLERRILEWYDDDIKLYEEAHYDWQG